MKFITVSKFFLLFYLFKKKKTLSYLFFFFYLNAYECFFFTYAEYFTVCCYVCNEQKKKCIKKLHSAYNGEEANENKKNLFTGIFHFRHINKHTTSIFLFAICCYGWILNRNAHTAGFFFFFCARN